MQCLARCRHPLGAWEGLPGIIFKCVPFYERGGPRKVVKPNPFFPLTNLSLLPRGLIFASDCPWRAVTLSTSAPGVPSPPSSVGSSSRSRKEQNLGGTHSDSLCLLKVDLIYLSISLSSLIYLRRTTYNYLFIMSLPRIIYIFLT